MTEKNDAPARFTNLGLPEPLVTALACLGYEHPTRLQAKAIECFKGGGHALVSAFPGRGKTAVFAVPVLDSIELDRHEVQTLILVSGRERAHRVCEALEATAAGLLDKDGERIGVVPLTGGTASDLEDRRLARAPQILVATPARLFEYVDAGRLVFEQLDTLVIDELDEILDAGQADDLEDLMGKLPKADRTWLIAAKTTENVKEFAEDHLGAEYTELNELDALDEIPDVEPKFAQVPSHRKLATIVRLLEDSPEHATLAFVQTRAAAEQLSRRLRARGFACEAVVTGMPAERLETLASDFENGDIDLLVCTDAGAAELEIDGADRVVHYAPPHDVELYAQRLALLTEEGDQVLLVTPRERPILYAIEQRTQLRPQPFEGLARPTREERGPAPERRPRNSDGVEEGMVRLFVGIGRMGHVRPGDLVGAIANEADVPGREIGAINIYDKFSFVELPESYKDQVLDAMGECQIRGRRVEVRPATPRGEGGEEDERDGGGRSGGGRSGGGGGGGRDRDRSYSGGSDRSESNWD